MKRYTLVFDGNYFLHKTVHISQKIKKTSPLNFINEPETDRNILFWKLATDFSYEIRKFSSIIDRVVYCIDSASWRKDFYPEAEYKGNRKPDTSIDWTKIYDAHNEFTKGISAAGITISRVEGTEGDDLIFGWSTYLNQNDSNCIIISGDNDLIQLVNYDKVSDTNTLFFNKFSDRLFIFPEFRKWLDSNYSFSEDENFFSKPIIIDPISKVDFKRIINSLKLELIETNVNEFMFRKIITGDEGDNVSPIYTEIKKYQSGKKKDQEYKSSITPKQLDFIVDVFKKTHGGIKDAHFFNKEYIKNIAKIIIKIRKINDKTVEQIAKKFELNRNLVYLHNNCIPNAISNAMLKDIESNFKYSLNEDQLHSIRNREILLEFLPYEDTKKKKQGTASFFDSFNLEC